MTEATKFETQEELENKILRKYMKPVIAELQKLSEARMVASVCRDKLGGLNPARIHELRTGKRPFTMYYILKLIEGGIVSVDHHILQGRNIEDLPEQDRVVIEKMQIDNETVALIAQAKRKGIAIKDMLKALLKNGD